MKALLLALLLALSCPVHGADGGRQPFTAHYQLLKNGRAIGTATMQLQRHDGAWLLSTHAQGRRGLAALAGLDIRETSRFAGSLAEPVLLSYRYRLESRITDRARDIDVDWPAARVAVLDKGKAYHYPPAAGMLDRQLLALVLGLRLASGQRGPFALPVATRDAVETQHFRVSEAADVRLPSGPVAGVKLQRSDPDKAFTAWYAPAHLPVPVRLQHADYGLALVSYSSP